MYVPDEDNYIVDGENYAPSTSSGEKKPKKKSSIKLIIIIIVALTLGVTVYFVSNLIFGGKSEQNVGGGISSTLSVDDPDVLDIYAKVTYGRNSNTLNKFQKEQYVSLKNFSKKLFLYQLYL